MKTATERFTKISASIKEKEKRLAEIQILKKHIFDYFKTKDVYADYRKCGYSKKFLEEHRQEILLHKAAKNAFDELHLKKLPKVKDLSVEYAEILAEKKKLYGEYRQGKKDMQEIQRAKYDIDQFLKSDEEQKNGSYKSREDDKTIMHDEETHIRFIKIDSDSGEGLSGAKIKITDKDGKEVMTLYLRMMELILQENLLSARHIPLLRFLLQVDIR
ncbi:MAG: hypothetical protein K6F77_04415 [Lachnospiraceae bacterium]|nr:hypothetical protein [Lachnospiraceae bacterium]